MIHPVAHPVKKKPDDLPGDAGIRYNMVYMDKATHLAGIVRQAFPQLVVEEVRLNEEGQFNDVLVLNREIVFRFPRYESGITRMTQEARLLQRLRGRLPLAIPDPVFSCLDVHEVGSAFMGYALIPGEPLWLEKFRRLGVSALPALAEQLAGFLQTLHALPVEEVGAGLPLQDGFEELCDMYARIRLHLFPLMGERGRRRTETHFDPFLRTPELYAFQPAIRHGDFGAGNILYLDERRCASGVVDWSSAGVGDPAGDIAAVSCFGQPFFDLFCRSYRGVDALLERARFYKGTFALQEALHGFTSGDQGAFQSGMAEYWD
jgi:aminoglycoside 2''-phosphotransferase